MVVGVGAQTAAERYALLGGIYIRNKLVLEDILELYVLYAGVERAVVDVERCRNGALILCREDNLPALCEIFAVGDGNINR